MGQSWGHTLRPFTAEASAYRDRWAIDYASRHPDSPLPTRPDYDAEGRTLCQYNGKCRNQASWYGTYRYMTGRAGRISYATRALCESHAEVWRAKYEAQ